MAKYHLTARTMELSEDIAAFLEQVKKNQSRGTDADVFADSEGTDA